ncbi:hypothetical protein INT45_007512 [Circinella minor]|uniref:Enoyl reductase (ER) domain-containing protein n=1 Tax=Circinella minor TaxID=1195481 RepID=A0A8H7SE81_9FUNG|nr:hypothetical protein INT45_007512 [Circinella minor]
MTKPTIPKTMHALQAIKFGSPEESLKYNEIKTPEVAHPADILVKVKAAGVNQAEAKGRAGNFPGPKNPPLVFGGDYSGIIVDKGAKVTGFNIGDAVYGSLKMPIGPNGSYAEYVLASQDSGAIVSKPDHLSFEEAGSVGVALCTAYQAITGMGNLPKEGTKKILVLGASGGVGTFAVQYAKTIPDTQVVGICSDKNAELVRSIGADRVVDYTSKEAMDALVKDEAETYDLIVDCVGGDDYYNRLVNTLKKEGTFSTTVGPIMHIGAEKIGLTGWLSMGATILGRKLFGARNYQMVLSFPWDKFSTEIAPLLADGKIKTVLKDSQLFDLKDGVQAHKKLESHRSVGKVVLRI